MNSNMRYSPHLFIRAYQKEVSGLPNSFYGDQDQPVFLLQEVFQKGL